jgi:hypothetical protein
VSKFDAFMLGGAAGQLIGLALSFGVSVPRARESVRADAIKAGAAEYVLVDPATGRTEFRWKAAARETGNGGGDG